MKRAGERQDEGRKGNTNRKRRNQDIYLQVSKGWSDRVGQWRSTLKLGNKCVILRLKRKLALIGERDKVQIRHRQEGFTLPAVTKQKQTQDATLCIQF